MRGPRGIDPYGATHDYALTRRGVVRQAERDRRERTASRYDADERNIVLVLTHTIGPFSRDGASASSWADQTYSMRRFNAAGAGTLAMETDDFRAPAAGRIVGGYLNSSGARTAGTATLVARIDDGVSAVNVPLADAVLNATDTTEASALIPWSVAVVFAEGARIRASVTVASWTPSTANFTGYLVLAFEDGS